MSRTFETSTSRKTPNYALERPMKAWQGCAAGALRNCAPAALSNGQRAAAQRGRWASMHSRLNSRLIGSVLILCIGAYACSDAETSSPDSDVVKVQVNLAGPQTPIEAVPPCTQPLPVGGKRMAVDPDFPADVLLIIQFGSDGNASPAIIDRIEKKYGIELIPYLAGREQVLGGVVPLSNPQLAQMRCEPGVLSIKYDNPSASVDDVVE